jgi:acyl transferase domain-containing protein
MGKRLIEREAVFKKFISTCDAFITKTLNQLKNGITNGTVVFPHPIIEFSLGEELFNTDKSKSKLFHTAVSQPCIFAIEAGLTQLLLTWGIEPAAVVGHSIGEIAGAYAVGALSLEV